MVKKLLENQNSKFTIADAKLNVPVLTLSSQDNVKLLKLSESSFIRTINRNKYQFKVMQQTLNKNLYFLIDSSFHGVKKIFASSFEDSNI